MAEAIVNARLGEEWQAFSAGVKPAGNVHLLALRALAEIGIPHQARSHCNTDPFQLHTTRAACFHMHTIGLMGDI
jgi:protein-tyrosine-phosphatase